jgi:galactitol-specific phosphotransferase system IIB component
MKRALLTGLIGLFMMLTACGNSDSASTAMLSEEQVQETVQNYYNEMSKIEQLGKSSLEQFNETITAYSAGEATSKEMEKAIDQFQDTAASISAQAEKVEISDALPEKVKQLLDEAQIAFQSAYTLKEKASKGADSADVSAEEFNELNQNADLAMLYGISKLNEARVASGLLESEEGSKAATDTKVMTGTETDSNKK